MSFIEALGKVSPKILAIPENEILELQIPAAIYSQESVNLTSWANDDKEDLLKAKLDWSLVDDITVRAAALTEAESRWNANRFVRADAQKLWDKLSPAAYEKRDVMVHAFLYAYRKTKDIYSRIQRVAEGNGDADMILDLNVLGVIGEENPGPLEAIGYDLSQLDTAKQDAEQMQLLLAEASGDFPGYSETKDIRDRAYTYLKQAVDTVRECGQYLFYRNRKRYIGYTSQYIRTRKSKSANKSTPKQTQDQLATATV